MQMFLLKYFEVILKEFDIITTHKGYSTKIDHMTRQHNVFCGGDTGMELFIKMKVSV